MCLAQGYNTVKPVRQEPAASWSRVKHSTTEPLHSPEVYDVSNASKGIIMEQRVQLM